MVRQFTKICHDTMAEHAVIDKSVLSMVYAQAEEVVNSVRAKIKDAIGILPPMPDIAVKYVGNRVCISMDTSPWNDIETGQSEEDEDN